MVLEKVISQLILKHACVVVPDFGGFISQRVPSVLDFKTGKMTPPYKSVLFNKQLLTSDGLLTGAYAKEISQRYEQAAGEITAIVSGWKNELAEGKRIAIEHIGFLYLDNSGQVRFEQDKFTNLLLSSYGLPTLNVTLQAEAEKTEIENRAIDFIDFNAVKAENTEPENTTDVLEIDFASKGKRSWIRYVAAAVLLPIAFYSFWIPVKTDFLQSGILSVHDFNPFKPHKNIEFELEKIPVEISKPILLKNVDSVVKNANVDQVYSYEVDEVTYKTIVVNKEETVTVKKETSINKAGYYLIGNCFKVESNAADFVESMKAQGVNALVVDCVNGLYRVAVGAASDEKELEQVKSELREKGVSNYWLLIK